MSIDRYFSKKTKTRSARAERSGRVVSPNTRHSYFLRRPYIAVFVFLKRLPAGDAATDYPLVTVTMATRAT